MIEVLPIQRNLVVTDGSRIIGSYRGCFAFFPRLFKYVTQKEKHDSERSEVEQPENKPHQQTVFMLLQIN